MKYCIYKDAKGEWRWYLRAANHRKIADSAEGYTNRKDCQDAIALVQGSATAPVEDC